jgi:hypothetical protein
MRKTKPQLDFRVPTKLTARMTLQNFDTEKKTKWKLKEKSKQRTERHKTCM